MLKPVGFVRASGLIVAKDMRLEWRTLETLASSFVFSLIVLVIFDFAFGLQTLQDVGVARLVPGVIWSVLAFAGVVGLSRSFQVERQQDTLAAVLLTPIDRSALFTGKFLANLLKLTLLQWLVLPLSAVLYDYDLLTVAPALLGVVFLHSVGIAELGTLFAAVAARVGRGEALLATLLFPASAPLFISAVKCTAALLEGAGLSAVRHWLMLAAVFDLLYFLLALMVFEFVLEE